MLYYSFIKVVQTSDAPVKCEYVYNVWLAVQRGT